MPTLLCEFLAWDLHSSFFCVWPMCHPQFIQLHAYEVPGIANREDAPTTANGSYFHQTSAPTTTLRSNLASREQSPDLKAAWCIIDGGNDAKIRIFAKKLRPHKFYLHWGGN